MCQLNEKYIKLSKNLNRFSQQSVDFRDYLNPMKIPRLSNQQRPNPLPTQMTYLVLGTYD